MNLKKWIFSYIWDRMEYIDNKTQGILLLEVSNWSSYACLGIM